MNINNIPFVSLLWKVGMIASVPGIVSCANSVHTSESGNNEFRQRISINDNWRFQKYNSPEETDHLIYDVRPEASEYRDDKDADSKPTEAVEFESAQGVLKMWVLPTGNNFIGNPKVHHVRPEGNPGGDFPFVKPGLDESAWENVTLPHDWAIQGPFQEGWNPEVGGGMGRLPSNGVGWYRRKLEIPASDTGTCIFLDVDGAMSYATVWLNGNLVGGWPYGYNSWRLDLTPYVVMGGENQLAIRIDNPNNSARWYPGGGIYRNVWITRTNPVHVSQWGTFVTTRNISKQSATVDIATRIDNASNQESLIEIETEVFTLDDEGRKNGKAVASFPSMRTEIPAGESTKVDASVILKNPDLWGPLPTQKPNRYLAVTTLMIEGVPVDRYETRFGVRSVEYDPNKGILLNGELIKIQGVNQHHDLGALGAAFNTRAAERQLEILAEMGCNAIRFAHNPPAPELLELTDRMGFLVVDEVFDVWERKKTPHDFHLIFPDWYEQDLRAMIRRDKNHPSVIMWSYGNEVGEQYTDKDGAAISLKLQKIARDEDPTRLTTASMNWAKSFMPFSEVLEIISLNYQGEGIRQSPEFEGTDRIRTKPQYPEFHRKFPGKVILSSETASAASSRGIYLFPVSKELSAPIRDGRGGDSRIAQVSSYELHAVDFGSTADKVFGALEQNPYVAGEFVWNGFDYIGEPTPYYSARSSYTGIIDLAGFPKDRFYLYQAHWRPDYPMAHLLPHWNWPDRVGEVTPVHVFTSGDEAELFLNGASLGRKKKGEYEYRLRWDDVVYNPGTLKVIVYKDGKEWATDEVKTTGEAAMLKATADHTEITADGKDLSFITVKVCDAQGMVVPLANNDVQFSIEGPGEIVATDNGDPTCMVEFPSKERPAFNGLVLAIIRTKNNEAGTIRVTAQSPGLKDTLIELHSN